MIRLACLFAFGAVAVSLAVPKEKALLPLLTEEIAGKQIRTLDGNRAIPYESGFQRDGNEFVCDNGTNRTRKAGVVWSLPLNQREACPVTLFASSRTEEADGLANDGYSLYLDVTYQDGTHLWGQKSSFQLNPNAGWQDRSVTIFPQSPIRSIAVNLLFRFNAGRVRFRTPRVWAHDAKQAKSFDLCSVKLSPLPDGPFFLVRDVAAKGGFHLIRSNALDLALQTKQERVGDATQYDVTLTNRRGGDRAVTLLYAIPLPEGDLIWQVDPRRAERLTAEMTERMNGVSVPCGMGFCSRYPFGAVTAGGKGVALGLHPEAPAVSRVVCHPGTRRLFVSFDVGLSPEQPTARLRFCSFAFDGSFGFRGALERYQSIFPEMNRVRIPQQGAWMPFAPISKVEGWRDFGFRFKEGDGEKRWDDAHGILTFRYTEPTTWWMPIKAATYTMKDCVQEAERLVAAGTPMARAWKTSRILDEAGRPYGRMMDTPWCRGIVWNMNSAPGIAGATNEYQVKNGDPWFSARYAEQQPQGLDGEYVDSAELYVTTGLDFDRAHFAVMRTPLTFSRDTFRPGIFKGMIAYEYVRDLAERVHAKGRFSMANSTPAQWWWLAPYLDVMGTETDWNHGGKWNPMSDAGLLYRRALCGAKPYCFLMNTDFTKFTFACTEKFMQRALAYGMFPGFFSANAATGHYFSQPALYNRDRPLFLKYMPLCKRVAEAGWRPVNRLLAVDSKEMVAEQFGPVNGPCYVTLYNLSDRPLTVTLRALKKDLPSEVEELVLNEKWQWSHARMQRTFPPQTVRVLFFPGGGAR